MSNRNFVKGLGLLLLVPCLVAGLLPLLASYTDMLTWVDDFSLSGWGRELVAVRQYPTGASASVSPLIWVPAVVGELILIGVQIFAPVRPSRWRLTIR